MRLATQNLVFRLAGLLSFLLTLRNRHVCYSGTGTIRSVDGTWLTVFW